MPDYVVDKVGYALNEDTKPIKGSRVLVLGVAYKRNITDWRESPAVPIIQKLIQRGADVHYQDDFVPQLPLGAHGSGSVLESVNLDYDAVSTYDCVVVVTDHTYFDQDKLMDHAARIVDTRNLTGLRGRKEPKVVKL